MSDLIRRPQPYEELRGLMTNLTYPPPQNSGNVAVTFPDPTKIIRKRGYFDFASETKPEILEFNNPPENKDRNQFSARFLDSKPRRSNVPPFILKHEHCGLDPGYKDLFLDLDEPSSKKKRAKHEHIPQKEIDLMERLRNLPILPRARPRVRRNEGVLDRLNKVEWRPVEKWEKVDWVFDEDCEEVVIEEIKSSEDGKWIDYSMKDEEMTDYAMEDCDL
ncbi:hypothetical protein BZA77DRAFT_369834 [Pyronema omphalodes]|nr:hypothetical protein BZA77DRAFT_369834 [Pyronema omphalodes]